MKTKSLSYLHYNIVNGPIVILSNVGYLFTNKSFGKYLKTELQTRFAEVIDKSFAFSLLRQVKQKRHESIQIYAERIISLAEDAYQEAANTVELGQIE